ncbi:MAG TPA: tetratricopeptide repeat protein [candidate division Zixibacteria bacterium]|nr:tetratricopeptide repeat protein [candidate division Zixibacteria bacterium]
MPRKKITRKEEAEHLFRKAELREEEGDFRGAFRFLLRAAKLGHRGAQLNLGNFYTDGKGVQRNLKKGMYWYLLCYRGNDPSAANNIACTWRNEGQLQRALRWFKRAVEMGDDEANIAIGKYYLSNENNPRKAIPYFRRAVKGKWVSEAGVEEAAELLKQAQAQLAR